MGVRWCEDAIEPTDCVNGRFWAVAVCGAGFLEAIAAAVAPNSPEVSESRALETSTEVCMVCGCAGVTSRTEARSVCIWSPEGWGEPSCSEPACCVGEEDLRNGVGVDSNASYCS